MALRKIPQVGDTVIYRRGYNGTGNVTAVPNSTGQGLATVQETSPGSVILKIDRVLLFIQAA